MIAGGAAGVATFMVTGAGLVATPSPGSIFAYMAVTPKGGCFGVLARHRHRRRGHPSPSPRLLLGFGRSRRDRRTRPATGGRGADAATVAGGPSRSPAAPPPRRPEPCPRINGKRHPQGRRRLRRRHGQQRDARQPAAQAAQGPAVTVEHTPVNSIPADADVVVCHPGLAARARVERPGQGRSCRSRCSSATRR